MRNPWRNSLYLFMALAAALVIGVEGATKPFTAWNILPLLLAWIVVYRSAIKADSGASMRQCVSVTASGFSGAVAAVVSLGHLAWLFDWGETATGSSTSALIFVVLPLLALLVGSVAGGVAAIVGRYTGW